MFAGPYLEWNQKRIKKIVDFYGPKFFFLKKILDAGAGQADISITLQRLGADVTAVDARQAHLKTINKKFHGIKTIQADLDSNWPFNNKKFDIVLDLGLIQCLQNYEVHLRNVCKSTTHLVLETAVCDSEDPYKCINIQDNSNIYDASFNGISARPSPATIERILTECGMSFKKCNTNELNSGSYVYDWVARNNNECDINKRCMWFCVKIGSPYQFAPNVANQVKIPAPIPVQIDLPGNNIKNSNIPITNIFIPKPAPIYAQEKIIHPQNATTDSIHKNLKIAVCISGHMRTFEQTYHSFINNILSPYKETADIFINTWETVGAPASKHGSDQSVVNKKTELIIPQINELIKPKKINIETYESARDAIAKLNNDAKMAQVDKDHMPNGNLLSYGSMLYSLKQTGKMLDNYERENNISYDIIIRLRSDALFTNKPSIYEWDMNVINVPIIGRYYANAMNDQFAVGNSKNMKIYFNLFDRIVEYVNGKQCLARPEVFLKYHLNRHGIHVVEKDIAFNIIRSDGRVMTQSYDGQWWK
jgi:SAM-dependent methyltransferase